MFFYVSKVLSYLLSPFIWSAILLVAALFSRKQKKQKRLLIWTLIVMAVFTNSYLVSTIVNLWAVEPVKIVNLKEDYDVGIVLGGNTVTFDKSYKRETYTGNIDRLLQAVSLYNKGKIRKILVTGAAGDLVYRDYKEANLMASFLRDIGIPDSNILMDTLAENTHQNAVYVKRLLDKQAPDSRLLLITSSLHMRRAQACFRHQGLRVTAYATNPINPEIRWNFAYLVFPNESNYLIWNGLIHEMLGYSVYWLMGYL